MNLSETIESVGRYCIKHKLDMIIGKRHDDMWYVAFTSKDGVDNCKKPNLIDALLGMVKKHESR